MKIEVIKKQGSFLSNKLLKNNFTVIKNKYFNGKKVNLMD
jgi:hypothetical protein